MHVNRSEKKCTNLTKLFLGMNEVTDIDKMGPRAVHASGENESIALAVVSSLVGNEGLAVSRDFISLG